jgi:hypothetical protein
MYFLKLLLGNYQYSELDPLQVTGKYCIKAEEPLKILNLQAFFVLDPDIM